jgi:hypothetical protein
MAYTLVLAHPDEQHAAIFVQTLQSQLPKHTFTLSAARLVPFGGSVKTSLQNAFEQIELVLVLFSGKSLDNAWLTQPADPDRVALSLALEKGKPVQPILFPDGQLPTEAELPDDLKELLDRYPFRMNTKERFLELIGTLRALNGHSAPTPSEAVPPPAETQTDKPSEARPTVEDIHQFLAGAGITLRNAGEPQEHDEVLDRIALLMGTRYPHIRLVYQHIKRSLTNGETFTVSLSGCGDRCIADSTQLCTELRRLAFLEYYDYRRAPQFKLTARPSRTPIAYNFFTGGWLERFTRAHLSKVLLTSNIPFAIVHNAQVVLPEDRNFEFDLLLSVGTGGRILWFETKTADYQERIYRYSVLARSMNLPPEQVHLILLETPEQTCEELRRMYKMNVLNIDGLQMLTPSQLLSNAAIAKLA